MSNLKTIESKVKPILEKDEEARNDDIVVQQINYNIILHFIY